MNVYRHRELLTAPTWISFMMMLTNILMKLPSFTATPKDQNSNQILKYVWHLDIIRMVNLFFFHLGI